MMTTKGDIKLKLFDEDAPLAVSSFLFLAKQGFYNTIKFHRVIADFMIQGGDPLEAGYGGPKDKGINSFPYKGAQVSYPFKDEFESGRKFEKPGILASDVTFGSHDVITVIEGPNAEELAKMVLNEVSAVQGVVRTTTCIVVASKAEARKGIAGP